MSRGAGARRVSRVDNVAAASPAPRASPPDAAPATRPSSREGRVRLPGSGPVDTHDTSPAGAGVAPLAEDVDALLEDLLADVGDGAGDGAGDLPPVLPPLELLSVADANPAGRTFRLAVVDARPFARPTPCSRALGHHEVAGHRSLWCTDYDACLEHAAERLWSSWSRSRCAWFGKDPVRRADGEARVGSHRGASVSLTPALG